MRWWGQQQATTTIDDRTSITTSLDDCYFQTSGAYFNRWISRPAFFRKIQNNSSISTELHNRKRADWRQLREGLTNTTIFGFFFDRNRQHGPSAPFRCRCESAFFQTLPHPSIRRSPRTIFCYTVGLQFHKSSSTSGITSSSDICYNI